MAHPHPQPAKAAKFSWFDAALILLALAVISAAGWLSFDTLQNLGVRVGWGEDMAWLLPLCIDVQAAAGSLGWVHPTIAADTRDTARRMTIVAVILSVVGNGVEHLITGVEKSIPWWEVLLSVVVGALPVLAMALTIHLVSQLLVNRSVAKAEVADAEAEAAEEANRAEERKRAKARPRPPVVPVAPSPSVPLVPPAIPAANDPATVPAVPVVTSPDVPATVPANPAANGDRPVDPFTIVSERVTANPQTIGERLGALIDHLTSHGVPFASLSGRKIADNLTDLYGISCSEQRGRQVLAARRKQADTNPTPDTGGTDPNADPATDADAEREVTAP